MKRKELPTFNALEEWTILRKNWFELESWLSKLKGLCDLNAKGREKQKISYASHAIHKLHGQEIC